MTYISPELLASPVMREAAAEYHAERGAGDIPPARRPHLHIASPALQPPAVVELVRGDKVKVEPIRWLWQGWLARGKMHVLGGAPGAGKTTIAESLAAIVTRGGTWPDGSRCAAPGNAVIWSGEDDPADTLVPRLIAMGADMSRVFFVTSVKEGKTGRPFDPAKDMDQLKQAVKDIGGASLLIVDPIVSAIAGDSHKNSETRRGLQPLVDLAQSVGACLLGITHFTKGTAGRDPLERVTGSLAFGALARIVLVAAKNQGEEDGPARIIARAKSNVGPDGGGFAYDLEQRMLPNHPDIAASCVAWGEALDGSARELLAKVEGEPERTEGGRLRDAEDFLKALLAEGPMAAKDVLREAEASGFSEKTIRRAKKNLGIVDTREGYGAAGRFLWYYQKRQSSIDGKDQSIDGQNHSIDGQNFEAGHL